MAPSSTGVKPHTIRLDAEAFGMVERYRAEHRKLRGLAPSIVGLVNLAVKQWMRDTGAEHIEALSGKVFDFPGTLPAVPLAETEIATALMTTLGKMATVPASSLMVGRGTAS